MTSYAPIYKRPITLSALYHLQNPAPFLSPPTESGTLSITTYRIQHTSIPTARMPPRIPYTGTTCSESTSGEAPWTGAGSTIADPPYVSPAERERQALKAQRLAEAASRIHSAMTSVDPVHEWLVPNMITLTTPVLEVYVDYEIKTEERISEIGISVRNVHGEVEKPQGEFVKLRGDMEQRHSRIDARMAAIDAKLADSDIMLKEIVNLFKQL